MASLNVTGGLNQYVGQEFILGYAAVKALMAEDTANGVLLIPMLLKASSPDAITSLYKQYGINLIT
jgi:hypothetical protein